MTAATAAIPDAKTRADPPSSPPRVSSSASQVGFPSLPYVMRPS